MDRIGLLTLPNEISITILSLLVFALSSGSKHIRDSIVSLISWVLNFWLSSFHRVRHVYNGKYLPSVPYQFPNGQGDGSKFLYGRENSEIWQRELGPIYRIWSGTTPEIVLTKSEHVQEVFKDSDKHIKATNNDSGYFLGELLGKCVGLVSQEHWKSLRAITEGPFHRIKSITYIAQFRIKTEQHFEVLWRDSELSHCLIDPAQDLKMLPFWIVAEILYGQLTTDQASKLAAIAHEREMLFAYVLKGGVTRYTWSKYLPTAANKELSSFKRQWYAFNRQAKDLAPATCPIRFMYDAVMSGETSEKSVLHTIDETLFANLDVTLGGISWNLVFLAANPDVQSALYQEILTAQETASQRGDTIDGYIMSSSTLLAACISESARLRPLAAFSVPQAAPTARVVAGYHFPAGTNFIVDAYALNQRNEHWGKDGTNYRPQRFLERRAVKDRYNYWRFGFGPRQCMGKYIADIMIRVLLVHLVTGYELSLLDKDAEWERDMHTWISHPKMKLRCIVRQQKG